MRRRIAVVGDELTSGGRILDYAQKFSFTFHGHKTALIGNEAFCASCKSAGRIAKAGGPYRISYDGTREAALDGDIVLCKCASPARIVAVLAQESWVEDHANQSTVAGPYSLERATESRKAIYDEQIRVEGNGATPGYPYFIETSDGKTRSGRLDDTALMPRIVTDMADSYTVYWGDEALARQANP